MTADPRTEAMHDMWESGRSLRQVGDHFGLSHERVRQVLNAAGHARPGGRRSNRRRRRRAPGLRAGGAMADSVWLMFVCVECDGDDDDGYTVIHPFNAAAYKGTHPLMASCDMEFCPACEGYLSFVPRGVVTVTSRFGPVEAPTPVPADDEDGEQRSIEAADR